jgi:phage tail-like protein
MNTPPAVSKRLLALLPAIYREDPLASHYLWAFEQVLLGLEEQIDDIDSLFDPKETKQAFLPWLSSWMAFTLRNDLTPELQRDFLSKVVPLYRRRGTQQNLQELLTIFTLGVPTVIDGLHDGVPDQPHVFHVEVNMRSLTVEQRLRQIAILSALIDLEKPAHTDYELELKFPSIQVGMVSTVGVDTLIGSGGNP